MMLTNCKNCGAPLILGDGVAHCEYCGSEFTDELNVMLTEKRTKLYEARTKLYEAQLVAAQEAQTGKLIRAL